MSSRLVLVAVALALTGCEEFAVPADLDRPQIIAVIAEPPMVEPGQAAGLAVVVAGPDGIVPTPPVTWSVGNLPGQPPIGEVVDDAFGARFVAPAEVAEQPTAAPLEARLEVDGKVLTASKLVGIGALDLYNPAITGVLVDGVEVASAVVAAGQTVEVAVGVEPELSADGQVSWYSTAGKIELYRSNPTELVVDDEVGPAWLIAVVRDHGGQVVRAIELDVE